MGHIVSIERTKSGEEFPIETISWGLTDKQRDELETYLTEKFGKGSTITWT
jgi:hypothetical protein